MQDQPSLLSRMKDPYQELQGQEILNLRDHYLQDMTFNLQTPSLLMRMSDPRTLQGLLLSQTQNSIKMYSSDVTPLSNDIERGRSRKRQFMSRSNQSSPKRLEMIERDQMQLLDRSLQLSKAMISDCHGYGNPAGFLRRVWTGTGTGTNYCTRRNPYPSTRVEYWLTKTKKT